jgi:hypothetical protein
LIFVEHMMNPRSTGWFRTMWRTVRFSIPG